MRGLWPTGDCCAMGEKMFRQILWYGVTMLNGCVNFELLILVTIIGC